jgi:hypothetical protein
MTNIKQNILLTFCAIIGSLVGYVITTNFIVVVSIWQYLIFELLVSGLHAIYNYTKNKTIESIENE